MSWLSNAWGSLNDEAGKVLNAVGIKNTDLGSSLKAAVPQAVTAITGGIKVATGQQSLGSAIKTQLTSSAAAVIKTATPSPTTNNTFIGSTSGVTSTKGLTATSLPAFKLPSLLQSSSSNVDNPVKQSLVGASNTTKTVNGTATAAPSTNLILIIAGVVLTVLFFLFGSKKRR